MNIVWDTVQDEIRHLLFLIELLLVPQEGE